MIAGSVVHKLLGRELRGGPAFVVPLAPGDPASGRLFRSEVANAVAELRLRPRIAKSHAGQIESAEIEMDVRVVESRHHPLSVQIDDSRMRTEQLADFSGRAHGGDLSVEAGHGLRFGLRRIHRPDLAVDQNEVRV